MNNEIMKFMDTVELDTISSMLNKIATAQEVIRAALKEGHDYDTIPGTQKPTLLKPGAEKILIMYGLTSEYEILDAVEDWEKGIFAYTVRCILSHRGSKITEGLGSCNSKEDKYRYRWVKETDVPAGIDKTTLKINDYGKYRIENADIYSQVNTLLKMAKKRAQIDAVLTVASLSEVFTQDVEDMKAFLQNEELETMGATDAAIIKLTFGKHKGLSLGDVYRKDFGYLQWLMDEAKEERIRKACRILIGGNTAHPIETNNQPKNNPPEEVEIPSIGPDTAPEATSEPPGDDRPITKAQVTLFKNAAGENQQMLLDSFGYTDAEGIPRMEFQKILDAANEMKAAKKN